MLVKTNKLYKFIIFFSLVVFITSNVGLAVFTHSCSISGVEKSLFISYEDTCTKEIEPCCSHEDDESEAISFQNSCCSTQADYVVLDIDLRIENDAKISLLNDFAIYPLHSFNYYFSNFEIEHGCNKLIYTDLPPPKFQGRDFQNIYQVYII